MLSTERMLSAVITGIAVFNQLISILLTVIHQCFEDKEEEGEDQDYNAVNNASFEDIETGILGTTYHGSDLGEVIMDTGGAGCATGSAAITNKILCIICPKASTTIKIGEEIFADHLCALELLALEYESKAKLYEKYKLLAQLELDAKGFVSL